MQTIIIARGTHKLRLDKAKELAVKLIGDIQVNADYKVVEVPNGKKNISIDGIRELISEINLKPVNSKYKVSFINEAQSLSLDAQNALLKIIEEPPEYAQILMTVDHERNLIDTILSRCLLVNLVDTSKVDFDSDTHKEHADSFIKILKSTIGERIDWITESKEKMKDRSSVIELLNSWETVLADLMNLSISQDYPPLNSVDELGSLSRTKKAAEWADNIRYLKKVKNAVIVNNSNISLSLEALIVNL